MSIPYYVPAGRLSDKRGHHKGVSALSFSARGSYLASGGLDNKICIWGAHTKQLLHVVEVSVTVLSLDWVKQGENVVVCGLADGTVVSVVLAAVSRKPVPCSAHSPRLRMLSTSRRSGHTAFRWNISPATDVVELLPAPIPRSTSGASIPKVHRERGCAQPVLIQIARSPLPRWNCGPSEQYVAQSRVRGSRHWAALDTVQRSERSSGCLFASRYHVR